MAEALVALDTDAVSAWMRKDPAVQACLAGAAPALPALVLAEAAYGWILQMRKAEQRRRDNMLGRALERLTELHEAAQHMTIHRRWVVLRIHSLSA
jgi:predicted nucleic acid-binding protein